MIPYDKRSGKIWYNNELVDWAEVKLHVLSHGMHYASCVFEGFPELNQDDLHVGLGGGFAGRISNLTAMNMAITQDEAYELYMKGPKLSKSLGDTLKGGFKSFADSLSDE